MTGLATCPLCWEKDCNCPPEKVKEFYDNAAKGYTRPPYVAPPTNEVDDALLNIFKTASKKPVPDHSLLPRCTLPLTHAVDQIMGGIEEWTQAEVEQAIWLIDKPVQRITLHDVRQAIDHMRKRREQ
jgi:hypothetical protein